MKALRSVNSLSFRNTLMSWANAAMVSTSSSLTLRSESSASAPRAASWSLRSLSLCSRMRGAMSAMSRSVVSIAL